MDSLHELHRYQLHWKSEGLLSVETKYSQEKESVLLIVNKVSADIGLEYQRECEKYRDLRVGDKCGS